jgi:hypothetical protein
MTVIRLDAATLARLQADGNVTLKDANGKTVHLCVGPTGTWTEPTEEELQAAENDPVTYSFDEMWEKIRRGEKL